MRRGGPVPLYFQILQTIRTRIASGAYPAGSQLPTDEALMQEFGVSRHTVRSAVQELVSAGLIERFAGKGSFVLRGACTEPVVHRLGRGLHRHELCPHLQHP